MIVARSDAAAGRALGGASRAAFAGASRAGRSTSQAGAGAGAGAGRRLELDSPVITRTELGQTIDDDVVDEDDDDREEDLSSLVFRSGHFMAD